MAGSRVGLRQDSADVLQQTAYPSDGVSSINIALQVRKRFVPKCDGEIGELQQCIKELRNVLASLFE